MTFAQVCNDIFYFHLRKSPQLSFTLFISTEFFQSLITELLLVVCKNYSTNNLDNGNNYVLCIILYFIRYFI